MIWYTRCSEAGVLLRAPAPPLPNSLEPLSVGVLVSYATPTQANIFFCYY